jgi:hypothetical protein
MADPDPNLVSEALDPMAVGLMPRLESRRQLVEKK